MTRLPEPRAAQLERQFADRERSVRLRARRSISAAFVALALLVVLVWHSSYAGRAGLVESQRAGCARGTKDRIALATFIRAAAQARRAAGDDAVADAYVLQADDVQSRVGVPLTAASGEIDVLCEERFPTPNLFGG